MMELWGRKNAYNVLKVLWILDELELDYQHHDVGSIPGELETAEYLAINPHARVPTLVVQGAAIWESNSIVRYLAAEYSPGNLWPRQPLQRSFAERWMDWELSRLQPDFIDLFWGYYRTPVKQRNEEAIEAARIRCTANLQQLDDHLQRHSYLAGEHFSMADIPVATCLYRYFNMGLEVETPAHLLDWYQRLSQRRAYQNTIMVAFDELEGRVDY
jgi:glutathione S-transferase